MDDQPSSNAHRPDGPFDPEDLYPPRPRISRAASLAVALFLSMLAWALIVVLT
jgi:hypothetical protein